jgi:hypothetical protein
MSGWLKTGLASAIIFLPLTSAKIFSQPMKIAQRKKLLRKSKFIVSKNLVNKFAHGESILLTENHE